MFPLDYLTREQFEAWLSQQSLADQVKNLDSLFERYLERLGTSSRNEYNNNVYPLPQTPLTRAYIVTLPNQSARLYEEPRWWSHWIEKMEWQLEKRKSNGPFAMHQIQKSANFIQRQELQLKVKLYELTDLEHFCTFCKERAHEPLSTSYFNIYDDGKYVDESVIETIASMHDDLDAQDFRYYSGMLIAEQSLSQTASWHAEIACPAWLQNLHYAIRLRMQKEEPKPIESYGDLYAMLKEYRGLDTL